MCRMDIVNCVDRIKQNWTSLLCIMYFIVDLLSFTPGT